MGPVPSAFQAPSFPHAQFRYSPACWIWGQYHLADTPQGHLGEHPKSTHLASCLLIFQPPSPPPFSTELNFSAPTSYLSFCPAFPRPVVNAPATPDSFLLPKHTSWDSPDGALMAPIHSDRSEPIYSAWLAARVFKHHEPDLRLTPFFAQSLTTPLQGAGKSSYSLHRAVQSATLWGRQAAPTLRVKAIL